MEKLYYKPSELKAMGLPLNRIMELCRSGQIGVKSNPDAKKGFHYLIRLDEVRRFF